MLSVEFNVESEKWKVELLMLSVELSAESGVFIVEC